MDYLFIYFMELVSYYRDSKYFVGDVVYYIIKWFFMRIFERNFIFNVGIRNDKIILKKVFGFIFW